MGLEKYIVTNELWDVSRQEDEDFTYFYLHGIRHIHYDEINKLQKHRDFAGVDLRDGCLCIRVLRRRQHGDKG